MAKKLLSFSLLLSFVILAIGSRSDATVVHDTTNKCVYTFYIQTGWIWKAGTDSVIGATLAGSDGKGITISNLVKWGGLMGKGHDYFERGNLEIFSGRSPCLSSPPCQINLTSDGTGLHHGWYCKNVEVTATGPHMGCSQKVFTVEQWLARDAAPYQLYAARDNCPKSPPHRFATIEEHRKDDVAE